MADPRVVHVEVNGQRYPIRSALDPSLRPGTGDLRRSQDAGGVRLGAVERRAGPGDPGRPEHRRRVLPGPRFPAAGRRQRGGPRRRTGADRRSGPGNWSRRRPTPDRRAAAADVSGRLGIRYYWSSAAGGPTRRGAASPQGAHDDQADELSGGCGRARRLSGSAPASELGAGRGQRRADRRRRPR